MRPEAYVVGGERQPQDRLVAGSVSGRQLAMVVQVSHLQSGARSRKGEKVSRPPRADCVTVREANPDVERQTCIGQFRPELQRCSESGAAVGPPKSQRKDKASSGFRIGIPALAPIAGVPASSSTSQQFHRKTTSARRCNPRGAGYLHLHRPDQPDNLGSFLARQRIKNPASGPSSGHIGLGEDGNGLKRNFH